jgi:hypothetical protein
MYKVRTFIIPIIGFGRIRIRDFGRNIIITLWLDIIWIGNTLFVHPVFWLEISS